MWSLVDEEVSEQGAEGAAGVRVDIETPEELACRVEARLAVVEADSDGASIDHEELVVVGLDLALVLDGDRVGDGVVQLIIVVGDALPPQLASC